MDGLLAGFERLIGFLCTLFGVTLGAIVALICLDVAIRNLDIKSHTIGMFAVCASKPAGYQVVRKDTAVAANGFLRTTANCPSGKVVNGGGASVIGAGTANFGTRMQESAPGTTGLPSVSVHLATLRNGPAAHTIGVHAVCSSTPAGYQVVRKDVLVG